MKRKQGISLIVLILTIIVIVILATAVILSIANNNPIENAKEAKFKNDVKSMQEELELAKLNSYFDESEDITIDSLTSASNYKEKFVIKDGELKYIRKELTEEEIKWAEELRIDAKAYILKSNTEDGVTISDTGVLTTNWNGKIPDYIGNDIIIPDNVTEIDTRAFADCAFLKSVVISENVTKIQSNAFVGCTSLESITIPSTVKKSAYDYAGPFVYCTALKNIKIEGEPRFSKDDIEEMFKNFNDGTVTVDIDKVTISGSGYITE